ncbi:MAG: class I SAM-dependent methyltransferase [Bifidobacteriaceae bacterium]|jgi:hypothetical protein|nr:class I SAM-dependent methyltransferase [Bifidobacteriaceae bacterium]
MDLEDVALLTSDQGRLLLASLPEYDPKLVIKLSEGLRRRGIDPKLVAAALTQNRLRARARAKFGPFADQMLFTDQGLQQATRLVVAARHAERYLPGGAGQSGQSAAPPNQSARDRRVADLTGGIGGDALAMAALGLRVTVYERDPVTAGVARANLAAFPEARVIAADALEADLSYADALFADPSRRSADGRRVFDPAAYDPPLERLWALAGGRPLGVKVAPGIAHRAIPPRAEAEWVSVDRQVVEAGIWFGRLCQADGAEPPPDPAGRGFGPRRAALVIRQGRAHRLTQFSDPAEFPHSADDAARTPGPAAPRPPARAARLATGPLQEFIYEPDGAVIRACLIAEAAATLGPGPAAPTLVNSRIAYVTAAVEAPWNPFWTGYRVEDAFDFNLKRLRAHLRARGIGQIVVKKRGSPVDPAELRKRLAPKGDGSAVVILTRLGARQSVVIAQPLRSAKETP